MHLVLEGSLLDASYLSLMLVLSLVKVFDLSQVAAVDDPVNLPLFKRHVGLIGVLNLLAENGTRESAPFVDLVAKGASRHLKVSLRASLEATDSSQVPTESGSLRHNSLSRLVDAVHH